METFNNYGELVDYFNEQEGESRWVSEFMEKHCNEAEEEIGKLYRIGIRRDGNILWYREPIVVLK